MHLLPCPSCQNDLSVSPSQAGDETICPKCQSTVTIPKLGDLRQLPLAEQDPIARPAGGQHQLETSSGRRAGFVVLGLIATASLIVAAFCGIRWSLIEVEATTETHIAMYRDEYKNLTAAELIREYEQMERDGLDLVRPYGYKRSEQMKRKWGQNASIAAGIGGVAMLGACLLAMSGRTPAADGRSKPDNP